MAHHAFGFFPLAGGVGGGIWRGKRKMDVPGQFLSSSGPLFFQTVLF